MSAKQNNKIGISGLAAYVPPYRVWLEDWCEWTGGHWPKIQEVVGRSFRLRGPNHSVYTMSATAVLRLIDQYDIDPQEIRFLALGTESSTDNSAGAVIIKGMVDQALKSRGLPPLSRSCEVPEYKHACLGGVYAMKGALRFLATDGRNSKAIVISADIAEYARGSSGEPTQGAGAVAMLVEENPTLASIDLANSGSASDYRVMDFRKPMLRFCGQDRSETHQVQDFPVFNGKYSTTCYIDETLHAVRDMYSKRGVSAIDHMRSLKTIFMHRPYRRMPETGLSIVYLFALSQGDDSDRAELGEYCEAAGISREDLSREMNAVPEVSEFASEQGLQNDAYPLTMAVLQVFRKTDAYQREIIDKLSLGGETIRDLGNLYTAAMPAWLAAGLESALEQDIDLTGEELLTFGYGSGDAAEVIPFYVESGWREATRKIRFGEALSIASDLTEAQYEAMHDGRRVVDLEYVEQPEFVIEDVGRRDEKHFQDIGIEYYRYVNGA
ncbi:MAG: hydroxymethylglutaryl-CoA synthase [Woeseiaceae bacterium]|nr:hydroxymethylglutaryl-CoA synthase [Woeseiaceae bacterium]